MTCREMTQFLEEYVAGELQPQVLVEFESHVTECGDCTVFLSQYRTTIRAGAAAFHESQQPLPDALVAAILAACQKRT
jgi:predicted anti-sigma-YlaC factor YlaD